MSFYNLSNILIGCFITLLICLFGAFGGWVFMMLWNWLIPLFWSSAPILTFWEALGVIILISWIGSFFRN